MKRILCIGILYILANILILGNNFLYWDDWVWFHLDSTERFNAYLEMGSPISAALCDFFYALPNPTLAFRLLTFCSGFITALCYSSTLKKLHIISKEEYFVALALCALLPVSVGVKYLNCVAVYSFYIALFSIATRLVITESKKKLSILQHVSIPLFFISFTLNSLLVLYGAVLLTLLARTWDRKSLIKDNIFSFCRKKYSYIALPIFFWVIKTIFMKPYGLYVSYNQLTLYNLAKAIVATPRAIIGTTKNLLIVTLSKPGALILVLLCAAILIHITYTILKKKSKPKLLSSNILLTCGSFFLLYLALFPYKAIGAYPSYSSFTEGRHLILTIFGIIPLFIVMLRLIRSYFPKISTFVLVALIAGSIISTTNYYSKMLLDGFYQSSIIANLKSSSDQLSKHNIALVKNNSKDIFIAKRYISFYEYIGFFINATKSKDFFAINADQYERIKKDKKFLTSPKIRHRYNFDNLQLDKTEAVITISKNTKFSQKKSDILLSLLPLYWSDATKFYDASQRLLKIKISQLDS